MTADSAIATTGLTKRFGRTLAVDSVSLTVRRGEIVGFLGPNGAGKSTVMAMVMGLVEPDAGTIALFGVPDGQKRADLRMRIGYLQEKPRIYPDMTARAYLSFFAELYGLADPARRVSEVMARLDLGPAADRPLGTFSRGMQQRACLARIMLHKPDLLILDEPTLGLDPNGVADMRDIFRAMRDAGATLLFSSHQLAEMEKLCDSVIFLEKGRLVAAGHPADLLPAFVTEGALDVEIHEPVDGHLDAIRSLTFVLSVRPRGAHAIALTLSADAGADRGEVRAMVARALTGLGLTVLSVGRTAPSLDDIFIGLTGPSGPSTSARAPGGQGQDRQDPHAPHAIQTGDSGWTSDTRENAAS